MTNGIDMMRYPRGVKLFFLATEGGVRHFLTTFYSFELYVLDTSGII